MYQYEPCAMLILEIQFERGMQFFGYQSIYSQPHSYARFKPTELHETFEYLFRLVSRHTTTRILNIKSNAVFIFSCIEAYCDFTFICVSTGIYKKTGQQSDQLPLITGNGNIPRKRIRHPHVHFFGSIFPDSTKSLTANRI